MSLLFSPFGRRLSPQHWISSKYCSSLWAAIKLSIYPCWQLLTTYNWYSLWRISSVSSSCGNRIPPFLSRYAFSTSQHSSIIFCCPSLVCLGKSFAAISVMGSPKHPFSSSCVIGPLPHSGCISNTWFQDFNTPSEESHNVPSRSNNIACTFSIISSFLTYMSFFICILS